MRDFGGFPPVQYMSCVLEQRSDASATHEVSEPMSHEDHADLTQARQLTGRAEQPGDHWLLFALLRLGIGAQCIRDAGQYATGKHCHTGACAAHRRQPRTGTHAAGKLPHHACHTNASLHAEVLGVSRNFRHFPAKIGTHRLSKSIRDSHIVFFQLPQADQCLLEIVIGEVLPPGRKLLEGAMRYAGGFHERIVKLPHCWPCCRTWLVSSLTRSRIGWSLTAADAASVADVVGSGMSCSLAAAGHSVADFAQGRQRPPSFLSCATIRSSWAWSQASPGAHILWITKSELLIDPGLAKLGKQRRYFAQIVDIGHLADQNRRHAQGQDS